MSPPRFSTRGHKFSCPNTKDFIPVVGSPRVPSKVDIKMNKENKINFPINSFI